ncbi:MAG: ribonuclease HI [Oscillospiraceae bacterium]|nr:ribonuclease HI [Oscillospiraceae bacterium]
MKKINIYADGACLSNPGPGGYCAILTYEGAEKVVSGGDAHTTNNRMELLAAISGLEAVKDGSDCEVDLYTDSKYVADGITKGWAANWRRNNWIKSDKNPALNPELWERLLARVERLGKRVKFIWIKGHNGHPYNERCDETAKKSAEMYKKKL